MPNAPPPAPPVIAPLLVTLPLVISTPVPPKPKPVNSEETAAAAYDRAVVGQSAACAVDAGAAGLASRNHAVIRQAGACDIDPRPAGAVIVIGIGSVAAPVAADDISLVGQPAARENDTDASGTAGGAAVGPGSTSDSPFIQDKSPADGRDETGSTISGGWPDSAGGGDGQRAPIRSAPQGDAN